MITRSREQVLEWITMTLQGAGIPMAKFGPPEVPGFILRNALPRILEGEWFQVVPFGYDESALYQEQLERYLQILRDAGLKCEKTLNPNNSIFVPACQEIEVDRPLKVRLQLKITAFDQPIQDPMVCDFSAEIPVSWRKDGLGWTAENPSFYGRGATLIEAVGHLLQQSGWQLGHKSLPEAELYDLFVKSKLTE